MTNTKVLENATTFKVVENFSPGGKVKQIQRKIIVLPTEHTKTCFSELCKKNQDDAALAEV